jgi:RNA polymerase sigma factor (sigma-70 family)
VELSDFNESRWFAEHLQPHESMLRAWLVNRVAVRAEIDDIVQEAFVRVLRARQQGEVQSPKAFLFATARNLVLDAIRHRRVARTEPLVENEALAVLDEGEAIPEAVARNQELALLTEAIQSLPDRCRQVFTLRKVYGLSQREIAVQLGVSEHTVSAQLTIGLHKCTAYLRRRRDQRGGT